MFLERYAMRDLLKWKGSKRRKPLVLLGARQVGKTWILEEFGKSFPDGFVKFNFEKQPELHQLFQVTKEFMIAFYDNLLKYQDKYRAYKTAQLQIKKKYNDPYYWASFVLID